MKFESNQMEDMNGNSKQITDPTIAEHDMKVIPACDQSRAIKLIKQTTIRILYDSIIILIVAFQ